ncbi:MAG: hypothetical protein K9K67_14610 [Bacteriovoracaceae bacterium]|nr:hypothetical protein [Bacteriovoracaceae bacterium]
MQRRGIISKLYFYIHFIIIVPLFLFSCSKRAEFKYENNTAYIRAKDVGIDSVRVVDWKVGKYGKDTLSRGFRLSFDLPVLEDDDLKTLYKNRGANGWLIRLRRKTGIRNENLGYFAVEVISPKPGSESIYRYSSSKKGSVGVYYAASSVSTRLDQLPCPAFDHRLVIEEADVESSNVGELLWVSSSSESSNVSAKVHLISYSPITVNGGMELKGDYYIDIALYNTSSKERMTSFLQISNFIAVKKEEEVSVKGCSNYIVPNKGDARGNKKFKFGR